MGCGLIRTDAVPRVLPAQDELRGHLLELERGNFLKPTDTEGVWEFNMVERDIVYEVRAVFWMYGIRCGGLAVGSAALWLAVTMGP